MNKLPLLSLLIWTPIFGGIILLIFERLTKARYPAYIKSLALLISLICFSYCLPLLIGFDTSQWQMQWREQAAWIPVLHIDYTLGVDGFSTPLIVLSCFMTILVALASYRSVKNNVANYLAAFLIMQGLMCGVFSALNAVLFYVFWEAMLVPMFLIIGIWGGKDRIYATMKFFLYTFLGSVLLLVAIIYLQSVAKQTVAINPNDFFNIITFQELPLSFTTQKWLFMAFLIAFAVKIPMWPVHTWLPDAHVEAPTGGSVVLAAILLKMGGYGLLRFVLPITPDASQAFAPGMIGLSLVAIIYIAFVAIAQRDMKKLIAYSSISHMGFVTLGMFVAFVNYTPAREALDPSALSLGINGAMIQMISHGFVSAALFLCVGVLYDRLHSRMIKDYGGVVNSMPIFASFFMLFALANVGLPGTSGFVGEFLVILAAFQANFWIAFGAATILILGASYTLWMFKRVVWGPVHGQLISGLRDIDRNEIIIFVLLTLAILGLGLWPRPLLDLMQASSEHLIQQIFHSKL